MRARRLKVSNIDVSVRETLLLILSCLKTNFYIKNLYIFEKFGLPKKINKKNASPLI